jgi:S-adenosylmethionine:tRNA-ribosyltransferase-isomerase (queuine synthetase)
VHFDTELFETLSDDGLVRKLAGLHMAANEIPAVGIPPARRMAMRQEHVTVAHERSDGDQVDNHDCTLRAACAGLTDCRALADGGATAEKSDWSRSAQPGSAARDTVPLSSST